MSLLLEPRQEILRSELVSPLRARERLHHPRLGPLRLTPARRGATRHPVVMLMARPLMERVVPLFRSHILLSHHGPRILLHLADACVALLLLVVLVLRRPFGR